MKFLVSDVDTARHVLALDRHQSRHPELSADLEAEFKEMRRKSSDKYLPKRLTYLVDRAIQKAVFSYRHGRDASFDIVLGRSDRSYIREVGWATDELHVLLDRDRLTLRFDWDLDGLLRAIRVQLLLPTDVPTNLTETVLASLSANDGGGDS
ncbi:hypothetical protein HJC99_03105 [Candidatus Saccharibacteria bacterium]|nr:hypothetical protein [Candidatus Saccharibacteria bacterium]